jgi:hypothetical protein
MVLGALLAAGTLGSIGSMAWANWPAHRAGGATVLVGDGGTGPLGAPTSAVAAATPDVGRGVGTSSFSITGSVGGLFPGKTFALTLTVANPHTVAITVTSITTTVGAASLHCGANRITVTAFAGHLVVHAGKKAKAVVHVTLAHTAPNTCQGAHFPFHYRGLATAA